VCKFDALNGNLVFSLGISLFYIVDWKICPDESCAIGIGQDSTTGASAWIKLTIST